MYNQPETIIEKYGLTASQITKGRGTYICSTGDGMKVLAPFGGSAERADFLAAYLRFLHDAGFEVEQIVPTQEGAMVAEDESGTRYILKSMTQGSECSTKKWDEMRSAVQLLAGYHRIARNYEGEVPDYLRKDSVLADIYRKHIRELVLLKNYVKTRRRKNDFEQKFARQYPYFIERANDSLGMLEAGAGGERECLLCHGEFNQHNVLRTREGYRMINFEHLCFDVPMSDLGNFVRKMMEKNNWKEELGIELIEAYDRILPISESGRRQLYIMLQFPEKFWKIANHYSNSHKAWVSGRDLEKLERVIDQEEARQKFLRRIS